MNRKTDMILTVGVLGIAGIYIAGLMKRSRKNEKIAKLHNKCATDLLSGIKEEDSEACVEAEKIINS